MEARKRALGWVVKKGGRVVAVDDAPETNGQTGKGLKGGGALGIQQKLPDEDLSNAKCVLCVGNSKRAELIGPRDKEGQRR